MAPEVAAVDRKGGYNQSCDIWSVGEWWAMIKL